MRPDRQFVLPPAVLSAFMTRDDATREWASDISAVARNLLQEWELRPEGTIKSGEAGVVVPVLRSNGTRAALKLQVPSTETTAAILGLARWDGRGTVRLLESNTVMGGMLLERLHHDRTLEAVENDDDAVHVIGSLLARLHSVPAPSGLPHVSSVLSGMIEDSAKATRALNSDDRSRVHRWIRRVAELQAEPGDRLLHWDLHYGNVLSADREPWLAIDPEPLIGDPGFDLWPALDSGWSTRGTVTEGPRIVRRRFDIISEMLDLDRGRAAGWTFARLLQNTLWDIADGRAAISLPARVVDDALGSFAES